MSDRDVLDEVLAVGCVFDWITPLWAIIVTLLRGGVTLAVPLDTGFGRNEVKYLLRKNGIDCWGLQYVGDNILYAVRPEDADRAERVFSGITPYSGDSSGGVSMVTFVVLIGALGGLTAYLWWVGVI